MTNQQHKSNRLQTSDMTTNTLTNGTVNSITGFLRGTTYKEQTGTITYSSGGGAFVRHHIDTERQAGRVVVLCGGYARVHNA